MATYTVVIDGDLTLEFPENVDRQTLKHVLTVAVGSPDLSGDGQTMAYAILAKINQIPNDAT